MSLDVTRHAVMSFISKKEKKMLASKNNNGLLNSSETNQVSTLFDNLMTMDELMATEHIK